MAVDILALELPKVHLEVFAIQGIMELNMDLLAIA